MFEKMLDEVKEALSLGFRRLKSRYWNSAEGAKEMRQIHAHNVKVKSRPVRFKQLYDEYYRVVRSKVFAIGPRAAHGCWTGGTRQQARSLARRMAREELRTGKAVSL